MAGIGTRDSGEVPHRAARCKTGHISLNTSGAGGLAAPCGGCKKSGVERDKGLEALEHSTQVKHVSWRGHEAVREVMSEVTYVRLALELL